MAFINKFLLQANKLQLICIASILLVTNSQAQNDEGLYEQAVSLQNQLQIRIDGLEKIKNEKKINLNGNPEQQLLKVLSPFNQVISRNKDGQIERIVIVNKKQLRDKHRIILPARLQGKHLLVPVSISGNGKYWQNLDMLIDTGADSVVLPVSMITELGISESLLSQEMIQTANGVVEAKVGRLQALKIAGEIIENVETAFIDDDRLGPNSLLGMSVLGQYQLTIDDKSQSVTLFKKN